MAKEVDAQLKESIDDLGVNTQAKLKQDEMEGCDEKEWVSFKTATIVGTPLMNLSDEARDAALHES